MDDLASRYCYRTLAAHGLAVGLSDGLMGNSEVGCVSRSLIHLSHQYGSSFAYTLREDRHLNIGAGRIVWQDIVRIDQSIKKRQFHESPKIVESMQHAKDGNGRLHLLGLVSRSCRFRFSAFSTLNGLNWGWNGLQPRDQSGGLLVWTLRFKSVPYSRNSCLGCSFQDGYGLAFLSPLDLCEWPYNVV